MYPRRCRGTWACNTKRTAEGEYSFGGSHGNHMILMFSCYVSIFTATRPQGVGELLTSLRFLTQWLVLCKLPDKFSIVWKNTLSGCSVSKSPPPTEKVLVNLLKFLQIRLGINRWMWCHEKKICTQYIWVIWIESERAQIVRPLCFYLRSVVRDIKDFINAFDERVIQWFFIYTEWIESIANLSEHSPITLLCYHLPSEVCNVNWSEILGGKLFSCNMSCVLVVTNKSAPAVDVGENSTYSITVFF